MTVLFKIHLRTIKNTVLRTCTIPEKNVSILTSSDVMRMSNAAFIHDLLTAATNDETCLQDLLEILKRTLVGATPYCVIFLCTK